MAVLVSDSFNRANDATTMGTTDSYAGGSAVSWTPRSGSVWGILNNNAYAVSGANPFFTTVDAGAADVSVTATIPTYNDQFVLFFRVNPANNTGLCFNATGRKLQSLSGSTFTTIAATSGNLVGGTTIKVTAQGSSITVYENGTQIITATSAINQTSTLHGLGNWRASGSTGTTGGTWDNFIVESVGATGTNYPVSLSETVSLSESLTKTFAGYKSLSDAVAVSESETTHMSGNGVNMSDSIVVTDSISKTINQAKADGITMTETFNESIPSAGGNTGRRRHHLAFRLLG